MRPWRPPAGRFGAGQRQSGEKRAEPILRASMSEMVARTNSCRTLMLPAAERGGGRMQPPTVYYGILRHRSLVISLPSTDPWTVEAVVAWGPDF